MMLVSLNSQKLREDSKLYLTIIFFISYGKLVMTNANIELTREQIEVMCPRCARPVAATPAASLARNTSLCRRDGRFVPPMEREEATTECDIAAAAYTRGIDHGIELAKVYILASVSNDIYPRPILNWTDVDKAVEEAKKGIE